MRYAIDSSGNRWDIKEESVTTKVPGGQIVFSTPMAEMLYGKLTWYDDNERHYVNPDGIACATGEPDQTNYAGGTEADWDAVSKPKHYHKGGMECIDVINAIVTGMSPQQAYMVGNVIKYLWRCNEKNGVEDVAKAGKYIDMLLKHMESK